MFKVREGVVVVVGGEGGVVMAKARTWSEEVGGGGHGSRLE